MVLLAVLWLMAFGFPAHYIQETWDRLERSSSKASGLYDPKMQPDQKPIIYISRQENEARLRKTLRDVQLRVLPESFDKIEHHGLLYLPHPYITPGGRFNEMYGWDSYFILLGLLEEGRQDMARHLVDNQLYQVEHYGRVLNSNRTYHLLRSHPPFLSRMVLKVYGDHPDRLKEAYPILKKYYEFWNTPPRHGPEHHLARYYDDGSGPAIEVLSSEIDCEGMNHFNRVEKMIREGKLSVPKEYYDQTLQEAYYLDDRAMRESGFDITCAFGPYGIETTKQIPVCLNSLLYAMEKDLQEIAEILDREEEKKQWKLQAKRRKFMINRLLWSEEKGLYLSYNIDKRSHTQYPFLTAYYPLFAGIATPEQAACLVNRLPLFERQWGLTTSTVQTGCQWDSPYGWAPLHLIVVVGLMRYGYQAEAQRIAEKFCSLVEKEFQRSGQMFEKYDVIKGTADVHLDFGYESNEHGFGWTNGVYLVFKRRFHNR